MDGERVSGLKKRGGGSDDNDDTIQLEPYRLCTILLDFPSVRLGTVRSDSAPLDGSTRRVEAEKRQGFIGHPGMYRRLWTAPYTNRATLYDAVRASCYPLPAE